MLKFLNKLKQIESKVASDATIQQTQSAKIDEPIAADEGGEWLSKLPAQENPANITCYETSVKRVPLEKLVWARHAGFKTSLPYFPARLCDNNEILGVAEVDIWPLPPHFAVIEYFCTVKGSVFTQKIVVESKNIHPYYYCIDPRMRRTLSRSSSASSEEDLYDEGDSEGEVAGDSTPQRSEVDITQWNPITVQNMLKVLNKKYNKETSKYVYDKIMACANRYLEFALENYYHEQQLEQEELLSAQQQCSSSNPLNDFTAHINQEEDHHIRSMSPIVVAAEGNDRGLKRKISSENNHSEAVSSVASKRSGSASSSTTLKRAVSAASSTASHQTTKQRKETLHVGDTVLYQNKIFKNLSNTTKILRIESASPFQVYLDIDTWLEPNDHIVKLKQKKGKSESVAGLVRDFKLVDGVLEDAIAAKEGKANKQDEISADDDTGSDSGTEMSAKSDHTQDKDADNFAQLKKQNIQKWRQECEE